MSSMFCFQCEQAAQQTGCSAMGVCGKDPETAALQDLLLYSLKGISRYARRAAESGIRNLDLDRFVLDALFTTVTNVNFDPARMEGEILSASRWLGVARSMYWETLAGAESAPLGDCTTWEPAGSLDDLVRQGEQVGIETRLRTLGHDLLGAHELLTYGLKGMAAYAHHAWVLGQVDEDVVKFVYEALDILADADASFDQLLEYALNCGKVNLRVMELLDLGHTSTLGNPEPSPVRIDPVAGKCILVSGHDLADLKALLEQTEGSGLNIYTHGEMLPAHGYPELKKYAHLAGHYGGAWQDQAKDFDRFPGSILMTTNCIQKPKNSYIRRIFTCGQVAWPDVAHIENREFEPLMEAALAEPGFASDGPGKTILTGFGHHAVMGVADKVIAAVKSGKLRRFFVVGGCDGAKTGRNYYTEFVEAMPDDCVVLTLGCGKFRFNTMELGDIGGIPRLLDCGQCNDAYSAIKIAVALADAFNCGVNELPLSLNISWYEQKAVAVLLTLLHLGIQNIRLGPTLPAFATPALVKVLQDNFNLMAVGNAAEDMASCLAG